MISNRKENEMTEEELLNKSFDGNLIPHPHMTEDERAEMFYKECMDNAGIKDYPPLCDS